MANKVFQGALNAGSRQGNIAQ
ncbi:unnamed protein product [Victoria cruziana]